MTTQEAIKDIKENIKPVVGGKSLDIAIEALEKQVPKKVIFDDDEEVLLCPNCNIDLMGSLTDQDHDPYYCFECGQALKWGE